MKFFKLTDLLTQAALFLAGLTLFCFDGERAVAVTIFYGILTTWQLLSFILHLFFSRESWYHKKYRTLYAETGLALLVLLAGGVFLFPFASLYFITLLFAATPLYITWYMVIVTRELQLIRRKELIHLKN
ncbi:MAG: hypothetical protein HYZ15_01825 [Sphingobacteriales bacterium]|nr:hypothetical protein [Sphingobacteriales bacterium]